MSLIEWVEKGDTERVRECIHQGVDVNARDGAWWTALMRACYVKNDMELGKLLLDSGADVNAGNYSGNTSLSIASSHGSANFVKLLLENGANLEAANYFGWTALMEAAMCGNIHSLKVLLENGADVEKSDDIGKKPLMHAVNFSVAELLLEYGVDVDAKDNLGRTALMFATRAEKSGIVKLLLENGADVEAKDEFNRTAFNHVICAEQSTTMKVLEDEIERRKHLKMARYTFLRHTNFHLAQEIALRLN